MHHAHIHRFPKMLNDEEASAASRWNYPSGLAVRRNGLVRRRSAIKYGSSPNCVGRLSV